MFKSKKGITLIALVVTIIVLLILAGISISMLSGDNSILNQAGRARDITGEKSIAERVQIAYMAALAEGNGNVTRELLENALDKEFGQNGYNKPLSDLTKVTINGKEYSFDGTITKAGETPISETTNTTTGGDTLTEVADIGNYLKVGDYVAYDPLHTDLEGTQAVETSKLSYTSPTGTGQSHGNGYIDTETDVEQTFTAKSDIKWRVLSVSPQTIELISQNVILPDDSTDGFKLQRCSGIFMGRV